MSDKDNKHAIDNAVAGLASIKEMLEAYDKAVEEGDQSVIESTEQQIHEDPLELTVRSGWYNPYDRKADKKPAEFFILLSTGCPASRIIGQLDNNLDVESARLEWQDWGTPWTEHRTTAEEEEILKRYAGFFVSSDLLFTGE